MIGVLDRPTSGKVFINGIDIFSLNDYQIVTMRNNTLGFIFQSYNLINRTTVLKNVEFPVFYLHRDRGASAVPYPLVVVILLCHYNCANTK
jgi:ABC-type lipoprotein export system ATPase subunit